MIKNYTTDVSVFRTTNEIHKLLARKGVKSILNDYDDSGKITAISFRIQSGDKLLAFKLPAKVKGVYNVIAGKKRIPRDRNKAWAQAERVTWRIIKDWIDAQIALVEADCAEMPEVFLPYLLRGDGTTMYEALINNNMKLLNG